MVESKGSLLEEIASTFFRNSGHYTLRAVPFRFGDEDITDVDAWTYVRTSPNVMVRGVVDVKNKRSPKAFERVLWVKGLQSALKCDTSSVVTTENNPTTAAFAARLGVSVIPKAFLGASDRAQIDNERMTHEQFMEQIRANPGSKADGDWAGILGSAKSRLVSQGGFPAFNRAMFAMKFFGDRLEVRLQHQDCALRCALMAASIACVSLDMAMDRLTFDTRPTRFKKIIDGTTFGDDGDGQARQSIEAALSIIAEGSRNGRAIAAQARADLNRQLDSIRADIIAEYFMRESNAEALFPAAIELEAIAHSTKLRDSARLSVATRATLGIFADYLGIRRTDLPIAHLKGQSSGGNVVAGHAATDPAAKDESGEARPVEASEPNYSGSEILRGHATNKEESEPSGKQEKSGDSRQKNLL